MKTILLFLIGFCWVQCQLLAQVAPRSQLGSTSMSHDVTPYGPLDLNLQIIDGEYFIDIDLGEGLNNHIPATYPQPEVSTTLPPLTLTDGQVVYVRFKNSNGVWCRPRALVYCVAYPTANNNITEGRYFINYDIPNPIPIVPPESEPQRSFTRSDLNEGDIISALFKSSNGLWGNLRSLVYHPPYPTMKDLNIDSCQYFINTPPFINVSVGIQPESSVSINLGVLSVGDVVYVRVHNTNGSWCNWRSVIFRPPYPMSNNNVLAGEYFIDNDLGEGQCAAIPPPYGQPEITKTLSNLPGFTEGRTLYVRFLSSDGIWCRPRAIPYKPALPFAHNKIVAGEWFLNTVPPGGGGTAILGTYGSDSVTVSFTFPIPPESTVVYARFKNSNLVWGPPKSKKFQHPAVPVLASPIDQAVLDTNRVVMKWHLAEQADSYRLQVSTSRAFDSLLVNAGQLTDTSYTVTSLQYGRNYCWRVSSKNDLDSNQFSTPWSYGVSHAPISVTVSIMQGWDMISNPVTNPIPDDSAGHLYPTLISRVFRFIGGYSVGDIMNNGIGYWGKFPGAVVRGVTGTARTRDSISVTLGWNMVGSISNPVDTNTITSIPVGIRSSNWFGFSGGYAPVTQIVPGKAYWVKASSAGKFVFANPPANRPTGQSSAEAETDILNSITITDNNGGSQTLYFGADANKSIPTAMYVMPPAPPAGAFDARFETAEGGSMVQTYAEGGAHEFSVKVQSDAYPLTIIWKMKDGEYELVAGGAVQTMRGEGTMKTTDSEISRLSLKLVGELGLPTEFALLQNYPNPFNPSTTIRYDLPRDSRVTLKIFDILGQEVATLVDEDQKAGYRSVNWSASTFASGVYFYRLESGIFTSMKKLLVLK